MNFSRESGHVELIACTLLVMFSMVKSFRLIGAVGVDVGDIVNFELLERLSAKGARMQRTVIQIYECGRCRLV